MESSDRITTDIHYTFMSSLLLFHCRPGKSCPALISTAARGLGVTRKALSELVNGHSGVSPDMAIRLSKAFGGNPEAWLRLQMQYDLWQAERRTAGIKVTRFPEHAPA